VIILFIDLNSGSYSTNITLFPRIGLPRILFLDALYEIYLMFLIYFSYAFRNLSFARLTNDLIVASNSCFILDASCFSSVYLELKRIVIRYSNARPFPVIPTLVNVDAGNSPRNTSNAFAFVAAR